MTGATIGAEITYPTETTELSLVFCRVRVTQFLDSCIVFTLNHCQLFGRKANIIGTELETMKPEKLVIFLINMNM
jgi:hypothetical protein